MELETRLGTVVDVLGGVAEPLRALGQVELGDLARAGRLGACCE